MGRWLDRLSELEAQPAAAPEPRPLAGDRGAAERLSEAILAALAGDARLTTRELADRLGVLRDDLYGPLAALLDAKRIGTDPKACRFYRRPEVHEWAN